MRVPFHPQPSTSTCVAACTKMLLAHRGIQVPMRVVSKGVKTERGAGAYYEEAGIFLMKYGLTPVLFSKDVIKRKSRSASFESILRRLQAILDEETCKHTRAYVRTLNAFITKGGVFRPRRLSQWELMQLLKKGVPVLATISFRVGTEKKYHAILVTGYSKKYICYLDPSMGPTRIRRRTFAKERRRNCGDALYIQ